MVRGYFASTDPPSFCVKENATMTDEKKKFETLEELEEEEAKIVAGGYRADGNLYTPDQYSLAGVTWERNLWSKDRYFIRGIQIDQALADKIVDKYFLLGRQLTDEELRALGVPI